MAFSSGHFSGIDTFGMDSTPETVEPSPYFYPQHTSSSSETFSVVSYEEIQARPLPTIGGQEHSYVSFYDPQKPQYLYDDPVLKSQSASSHLSVSHIISKYKCAITFVTSFITFTALILIFEASGLLSITFPWVNGSMPENTSKLAFFTTIPYECEEWYVPASSWSVKLNYNNCAKFEQIQRVTVTQIKIDDCLCDGKKTCESYLNNYVFNQTVLHYGQLEYEFFFGEDVHVFEGRNWDCVFKPGELRFGFLGDYEVDKLGKAWNYIYGEIISFGLENSLISPNVCFEIDPKTENCP